MPHTLSCRTYKNEVQYLRRAEIFPSAAKSSAASMNCDAKF